MTPYFMWRAWQWIRYPRENFSWRRKWRNKPKIGDRVEDCRYEIHTVVGYDEKDEDTLLFEDGSHASWMHCCNYPEEASGRKEKERR